MFENYQSQKHKLLNQYTRILEFPHFLPIENFDSTITAEDIQEKQKALENEHFFVSITGQIKAGKSTLINALIFEEEVIPADDTPHTAKITLIKYGETPKLEVTFYNSKEWKTLKENSEFYKTFLKPEIEQAISKGLYEQEVIHTNALIKSEKNLANLNDYVARSGKYTPFVNLVTLYYPNEMLKEITVVDTPGTNDPNKLRDSVAKEWIHKTDANIYITYANQAMDKVDFDFIDKFLIQVPKEQKLTVINKIDSVNGMESLNEYIDELFQDDNLIRREVVSNRENLVYVSGLGALIDAMLNADRELNEDLKYYAEQLDANGFLEPNKHNLPVLKQAIEQKLIETKGENILSAHKKFIMLCVDRKEEGIQNRLTSQKDKLKDLFKSNNELEKTQELIKESQKKLTSLRSEIQRKFETYFRDEMEKFPREVNPIIHATQTKIEKEVRKIKQTNHYQNEVLWIVKDALNSDICYGQLHSYIVKLRDKISNFTENEIKHFKDTLYDEEEQQLELDDIMSNIFDFYTNDVNREMEKTADEVFNSNRIENIVQNNSSFLQRVFDTKGGLSNINSALYPVISESLKNMIKDTQNIFEKQIKDYTDEIFEKIEIEIKKKLKEKDSAIEIILKETKDRNRLIAEAKKHKDKLEQEWKKISDLREEII